MFKFIKRFLLVWKLTRDPSLLLAFVQTNAYQELDRQIRKEAAINAKTAVAELMPEDRHAYSDYLDVTLNVACAEIMTPQEAQRVFEESRIENKTTKLYQAGRKELGNQSALIKHNEEYPRTYGTP